MLQRISAAACGSLGFGGARFGAAAAATSASSSAFWLRAYSDAASGSGDKPDEAAAAPAAPAGGDGGEAAEAAPPAEAPAEAPAAVHPALIDDDGTALPPEMFSKRQLAWMGLGDPEKTKHFLPRLSRAELGSFSDDYVAEEFDVEQDLYPEFPEDQPLYDLRKAVPEIYQPRSELFERMRRLKEQQYPDMPIDKFVSEVLGFNEPEEQPPRPGARPYIRWQVCHVLSVGVQESHPANRKVKAWVYLRDLQREHGLTDAALQHIAAICGPRYNPNKGQLKLTSDRYPHREANRAHIRQIIDDLVAEGHRKHPAQQQQQQQAAAAAAP